MRQFIMAALLALGTGTSFTSARSQPFTDPNPRVQLAQEFVREVEVLYRLQETGKKEVAEDTSASGQLVTSIRVGTRTLIEMKDSIARLDGIALDGQWAEFRDDLKELDGRRIEVAQQMIEMSKTMLSGPKPNVDYGALVAHAPELTVQVEQIDQLTFKLSQAFFFGLVDERRVAPDGKLHHLLVTKKDRAGMIKLIDDVFGAKLEEKNSNYIVGAAWAMKLGLTRPTYKAADEP